MHLHQLRLDPKIPWSSTAVGGSRVALLVRISLHLTCKYGNMENKDTDLGLHWQEKKGWNLTRGPWTIS